jgi:lipopolysaccharide export system protein LptA
LAALALPFHAWAQPRTVWFSERPEEHTLKVSADHVSFAEANDGVLIYSGHVRVIQGDEQLTCSVARAHYIPGPIYSDRITRIECEP